MTVCIAALAEDSKAIVCVADKALTYGGIIQWDADSTKIVQLGLGRPVVLTSGGEEEISRVVRSLHAQIGSARTITQFVSCCEKSHKDCYQDLLQKKLLDSRLLTRKEYVSGITGSDINPYMQSLAESVVEYGEDQFSCGLLVCGFDSTGRPFILYLGSPGIATDMTQTGFHAIGSGVNQAIPRLLWLESKRSFPLEKVLYNVFDAKANSEINVGVGYEWDASVLVFEDGKTKVISVPKDIRSLIDTAWTKFTWSPFDEKTPENRPDPLSKDWKRKLREYADSIVKSRTKRRVTEGGKKARKRT